MTGSPVGFVLASATPPELVASSAKLAEDLGFSEIWIPEDYWYLGSVSCLIRALSETERINVGVGVMSALVRHPAVAAMELGCAERMFPGRVMAGFGLGLPVLMNMMGLKPTSQLGALRDGVAMARALLAGEECTTEGGEFTAQGVRLTHPPASVPPIYTGVLGPKMVRLSGEIADGTVVSAMASAAYLRWMRPHIEEGAARRAEPPAVPHRLPTFAMYSVADDIATARAAVRPLVAQYLSLLNGSPLVTANEFAPAVAELCERGGTDAEALIRDEMPDEWLDALTVAGDPATCASRIDALRAAGADSVILMPVDGENIEATLRLTSERVLPLVGDA